MNYLAHAYYSFHHREVMVGNLISDFVKGKKRYDYDEKVQIGIELHRRIDTFTDTHPATKEAKQFFKPSVGLYAGAFVDVVYDHFLANDQTSWQEISLKDFAQTVYKNLTEYYSILPERLQQMLPHMKSNDWLGNYHHKPAIERSFEGVMRRAVYLNNSIAAYQAFEDHYIQLQQLANEFLPDVKRFSSFNFQQLLQS